MLGPPMRIAMPPNIIRFPSVVISAFTRALATSTPLSHPPNAASASPAITAGTTGQRQFISRPPVTTPTIEITEPTERSKTPAIMSIIIPTDTIPSAARLFRIARAFCQEKNVVG